MVIIYAVPFIASAELSNFDRNRDPTTRHGVVASQSAHVNPCQCVGRAEFS